METPLSERYRPKTFEELVGIDRLKDIIELSKEPKTMPNLFFFGPQGTGKSSMAKLIINSLKPIDVMQFNGSDKTSVDNVREKVMSFITAKSSQEGKPKLVWIEEVDYMSEQALAALREPLEKYLSNARFICTSNTLLTRIKKETRDAVLSRFTLTEFFKPSVDEIFKRISYICEQESIKVDKEILTEIIKKHKGDLRAILNSVQRLSSNFSKTISKEEVLGVLDLPDEVYRLIISADWTRIRYEIPNKFPDYNNLLVELDELFFNSEIPIEKKVAINDIIAEGQVSMNFSFDENICFSSICSKIIKEVQK